MALEGTRKNAYSPFFSKFICASTGKVDCIRASRKGDGKSKGKCLFFRLFFGIGIDVGRIFKVSNSTSYSMPTQLLFLMQEIRIHQGLHPLTIQTSLFHQISDIELVSDSRFHVLNAEEIPLRVSFGADISIYPQIVFKGPTR